jgi:hypothetical protein
LGEGRRGGGYVHGPETCTGADVEDALRVVADGGEEQAIVECQEPEMMS